jgi:hypothetical protein
MIPKSVLVTESALALDTADAILVFLEVSVRSKTAHVVKASTTVAQLQA